MPMLNFMPRFVEPIRLGFKCHTIRANRKVPVKVGDKLYLYCGARHPGCFRILPDAVACTKVLPIRIGHWTSGSLGLVGIQIEGIEIERGERDRLAIADGFTNWTEMLNFWIKTHGGRDGSVHFTGSLIHWRFPEARA